jgi:hypothetical protein
VRLVSFGVACALIVAAGVARADEEIPRDPAHAVVVVDEGMDAVCAVVDDAAMGKALLRRMGASRDISYRAEVAADGGRRFLGEDAETRFEIEVHPVVGERRVVVEVSVSLPFEDDETERRRADRLAVLVQQRARSGWVPPPPVQESPRPYAWQIAIAEATGLGLLIGPIVHAAHGRPLLALASFGLRMACLGSSAGSFGGLGVVADNDSHGMSGVAGVTIGLGAGLLAGALLDILWLAK